MLIPKNSIFFLSPGLIEVAPVLADDPTGCEKSLDNYSYHNCHKKYAFFPPIEQSTVKCSGFSTVRAYSILVFYKG